MLARAFAFYGLAFAGALAVALAAPLFGEATPLVTMLTPAFAVIAIALFARPRDVSMSSLGLTRAGSGVWPLAVAIPVVVLVLSDIVLVSVGLAHFVAPDLPGPVAALPIKLSVNLLIGIAFALSEEVGWRGYMQPRLWSLGGLRGSLLTGFLHGVWHLPLILLTPYYHPDASALLVVPLFLTTLTLAGVFYGWLRNASGSVWPVAIAHGVYNFAWGFGAMFLAAKTPETMEYVGGESGLLVIAALIVIAVVLAPRLRTRAAP
ncbi:MAG: CPBP family intramembrane metalloprotease [Rhizobiaceae bacterium]|nr:CPBP family intramembrane metalloprotease [Rhizobiaceae bacterium]